MVRESSNEELARLRKLSQAEANNLREYVGLLKNIVRDLQADILHSKKKAADFLERGQMENHRHTLEKIEESRHRLDTCFRCIEECEEQLGQQLQKLQEFDNERL